MQTHNHSVKDSINFNVKYKSSIDHVEIENNSYAARSLKLFYWIYENPITTIHFEEPYLAFFTLMAHKLGLIDINITLNTKEFSTDNLELAYLNQRSIELNNIIYKSPEETPYQLTIVIAHKNRAHYLSQLLEILNQKDCYKFQVVVVDDNSENKVRLYELQNKNWSFELNFIFNSQDFGARKSRNIGAEASAGTHILFFDDDNLPTENALDTIYKIIDNNVFDITVFPYWRVFERKLKYNSQDLNRIWLPLGGDCNLGLIKNTLGDMNFIIKKDVFFKLGGINSSFNLSCEDWEFLFKALTKKIAIGVCPLPIQFYYDQFNSFYKQTPQVLSEIASVKQSSGKSLMEIIKIKNTHTHSMMATGLKLYSLNQPQVFKIPCKDLNKVPFQIGSGLEIVINATFMRSGIKTNTQIKLQKGLFFYELENIGDFQELELHFPPGLFYIDPGL